MLRSRRCTSPTRSSWSSRLAKPDALFGTVKQGDVADAVEAAGLGRIDKRKVELPAHIKSTGPYQANVRLHDDVSAVIELDVVAGK